MFQDTQSVESLWTFQPLEKTEHPLFEPVAESVTTPKGSSNHAVESFTLQLTGRMGGKTEYPLDEPVTGKEMNPKVPNICFQSWVVQAYEVNKCH